MKTKTLLLSVAILIGSLLASIGCQAQKTIKGNGYTLMQNRDLPKFTSISVSSDINVYISIGEAMPIRVEADDNLFPYIKTEVRSGTLYIYVPDSVNLERMRGTSIYISTPQLESVEATNNAQVNNVHEIENKYITIQASDGAEIKMNIDSDKITINAHSAANVELKGECDNLFVTASGASTVKLTYMESDNCQIIATSGAKIYLGKFEKLNKAVDNGAKLYQKGKVISQKK